MKDRDPLAQPSTFHGDSANLDLIRAVAVLCVAFGHLYDLTHATHSLTAWHFAQLGVLIFFVHTSMVLMLSLERASDTGGKLFATFYLRRFFRLYPLSIFCVTLAFVLDADPDAIQGVRHWTWPEFFFNATLTANLADAPYMVGGLWTLPLEVQMYVVLPFLFLFCRARPVTHLLAIWVLSVGLGLLAPMLSGRLNVLRFAPCFVAGVLAWRLSLIVPRRLTGWLWPLVFVTTWLVFFLATRENSAPFRWAFCLTLGLLLPWFSEFNWDPFARLCHIVAKYSYGIYLSHVAVMLLGLGMPWSLPLQLVAIAVLMVICPFAMFHLIEQPMIRFGNRLAIRLFQHNTAMPRGGMER